MLNRAQCVSRVELLETVWKVEPAQTTNFVDVYVNYVRRKLKDPPPGHLIRTVRGKIELHSHTHMHSRVVSHSHWHIHTGGEHGRHEHSAWGHVGLRPLVVGMVHGAAGSAALMLLVLSTIRAPLEAFIYILVFGFGSVAGMLVISLLLALPLHWAKQRVTTSYRPIQLTAGLFSCLFGLYLGIEIWSSMPR